MKKLMMLFVILNLLVGCKKEAEPQKQVSATEESQQSSHARTSCDFYTQGVHSLSGYDALVSANTYPLNLMTTAEKEAFRNSLVFMNISGNNVIVGFQNWYSGHSLTVARYVELLNLVVGIDPYFSENLGSYNHNEDYPPTTCEIRKRPNPNKNHDCEDSYSDTCCKPSRKSAIENNCD